MLWNCNNGENVMKKRIFLAILISLVFVSLASAQYAYRIAPVTALPATCDPRNGSIVALTGSGPVAALYNCTSLNTWTQTGALQLNPFILNVPAPSSPFQLMSLSAASVQQFYVTTTGLAGMNGIQFITPLTAVTLSGTAPNGSVVYCSDCTLASPCAAGGTGAIAKRLNGAWVCN
jgi:hypothetical protein